MERRAALTLTASILGFSMVLLDTAIVNVAAPAIRDGLGVGESALQWVVNAYTLVFAALLLSMGALADRVGPRNVFLAGLAVFAVGSAFAAAAPSAGVLIAAQAVLGIGAALVLPTSLALISLAFANPAERSRALGLWAAGSALAFALGPVVGGALTDTLGWRAVFALNLPPATLAFVLAWRVAPRRAGAGGRRVGAVGQVLAAAAFGALTFGLIEGGGSGWGATAVVAGFAVAAVTGALLVTHQRRTPRPMIPASLIRDRRFSASTAAGALVNLALYGELFVMLLFLQQERGLSALEAGLANLPQPLLIMAVAPLAGRLVARRGPRLPLMLGGIAGAAAALVLLTLDRDSPYALLAAGLLLNGAAGGLTIPAVTAGAMGAAPPALAGIASAGLNAGRQVGGAIGVALLGALAATGDTVLGLHLALAAGGAAFAGAALTARALPARTRAEPAGALATADA